MRDRDRGVSDVVGYVLLIGVVTTGVITILLLGGTAVSELKGDTAATAGETSLGQADRRIAALSGTRVNTTRFQLRGVNPGDVAGLRPADEQECVCHWPEYNFTLFSANALVPVCTASG